MQSLELNQRFEKGTTEYLLLTLFYSTQTINATLWDGLRLIARSTTVNVIYHYWILSELSSPRKISDPTIKRDETLLLKTSLSEPKKTPSRVDLFHVSRAASKHNNRHLIVIIKMALIVQFSCSSLCRWKVTQCIKVYLHCMCQHRQMTLFSRIFSFHLSRMPLNGFHFGDVNFCLRREKREKNKLSHWHYNQQTLVINSLTTSGSISGEKNVRHIPTTKARLIARGTRDFTRSRDSRVAQTFLSQIQCHFPIHEISPETLGFPHIFFFSSLRALNSDELVWSIREKQRNRGHPGSALFSVKITVMEARTNKLARQLRCYQ